jgi:hypothetical protein
MNINIKNTSDHTRNITFVLNNCAAPLGHDLFLLYRQGRGKSGCKTSCVCFKEI